MKLSLSERVFYTSEPHNIYYKEMETHLPVLESLQEMLLSIKPFEMNIEEAFQLGLLYKTFYTIYSNKTIHTSLYYALGYQGYMNVLNELYKNVELKLLSNATFYKKCKKDKKNKTNISKFKDIVYPVLIKETKNVPNDISLDKNMILTGVNASGKTTMLKSVFINIILSQQIGIGSFSSFSFQPYDYLHCYINIIDTSDRYSLFQSECKKCQEIIQSIQENPNKKHFCVFDEIFSGTTPDEAIKCGYGFLTFLNSNPNIRFILTTHFMDLCKQLENDNISNYKMVSTIQDKTLLHTYKLEKGINDIQGSVEILRQLNFPEEVISTICSL
jgi:DNA mismatch repair ATPase MutS